MEKKSTSLPRLNCVYGVSFFNIFLTLATIAYLGYAVYTLNNRVALLEVRITKTEELKHGKKFVRSVGQDHFMKPCEECRQICSDILGRKGTKVSVSLALQREHCL